MLETSIPKKFESQYGFLSAIKNPKDRAIEMRDELNRFDKHVRNSAHYARINYEVSRIIDADELIPLFYEVMKIIDFLEMYFIENRDCTSEEMEHIILDRTAKSIIDIIVEYNNKVSYFCCQITRSDLQGLIKDILFNRQIHS